MGLIGWLRSNRSGRGQWLPKRHQRPAARRSRITFEPIEPRLLLSVSPVPTLVPEQSLQDDSSPLAAGSLMLLDNPTIALNAQASVVQETEPNNARVTANVLPLEEDPSGGGLWIGRAIGQQDPAVINVTFSDPDFWRLDDLQANDIVTIAVDTPDSAVLPYVELQNASGTALLSDSNGNGPDRDVQLSHYVVPVTGTYYIAIGKLSSSTVSGAYEIRVERTRGGVQLETDSEYQNDTVGGANVLSLSGANGHRTGTVAGTVMAAQGSNTDEDVFNLGFLTAGNFIELTTRLPVSSTLAAKVTLLNSANAPLPDIDGSLTDGHTRAVVTQDGFIYAKVEGVSGVGPRAQYLLDMDVTDPVPPKVTSVEGLPAHGATVLELVGPTLTVNVSEVLDGASVLGTQGVWRYNGHVYTVTTTGMTWTQAEAQAQALGGHLVTINDAAEQQWVAETFGGWGGSAIWLGERNIGGRGWASGEAVTYTNWGASQPNNTYSYMSFEGLWYTTSDAGLGTDQLSTGWGVIELNDAGVDGDGDGLPAPLDPYPSEGRNAWDLRAAGGDGQFETADDVLYTLRQRSVYTTGTSVELLVNEHSLGPGTYRFTASTRVQDPAGNALDGTGDGTGGDAYVHLFTVQAPAGYALESGHVRGAATAIGLTEEATTPGVVVGRGLGRIDPATYGEPYWSNTD